MKPKVLGKVTSLALTKEQYDRLRQCTTGHGGYQDLCRRVYDSVRLTRGKLVALVYEKDMERINKAIERDDNGTWQDLFREIVKTQISSGLEDPVRT